MSIIKGLMNKINQLMDDSMDEYADGTVAEIILGSVLTIMVTAIYLIGVAILMSTALIWGLPYLIYKVRKEQKNEHNKTTNK